MRDHKLVHHFGDWKPSAEPPETMPFCAVHHINAPHPVSVDFRGKIPAPWNQGQQGSCTGFAGVAHIMGETGCDQRSFADLYWKERVIEHSTDQDSGASMHDCMEVLLAGVGPESAFPYNDKVFNQKPPEGEDAAAAQVKLASSVELHGTNDMLDCLAQEHSFIFGVTVFDSFESEFTAKTGLITMPKRGEQMLGGHAQDAWGYHLDFMQSDTFQKLKLPAHQRHSYWRTVAIGRNSWDTTWGDGGFCYYPLEFLAAPRLASEFLTGRA